ncbi:hypothetical protein, partial [Escherichia marmotae]|uniref:hypothetical protein n=1 Tax=Escherichia marmotae TaxID=1499973 RepID=UPI00281370FB
RLRFSGPKTSIICSPMTSLKTSIKTITYLSDIGCLEIQGASLSWSYRLLFYYSHSPSSVLTNNSGINERWQTSLIQHQELKNYSATQQ